MARNGNSLSVSQLLFLIFQGENYEVEHWYETILKSQDLWDLLERGFADRDEENSMRDCKKRC